MAGRGTGGPSATGPAVTITDPTLLAALRLVTPAATRFMRDYYNTLDIPEKRARLQDCYAPGASVVWNGRAVKPEELKQSLPATSHRDQHFDVQPLWSSPHMATVAVHGTCMYKPKQPEAETRRFHQVVILQWDAASSTERRLSGKGPNDGPQILHDVFRWTAPA
eukprot:TRINITY_DN1266_c0_g1_i1.p2 TRINITY_DN1266_c0_g1~~TRINITY_DN1266_c0_g1_i1.p2  ORF type:complete len:165 (-),score=17.91 TRINITY_DN1266_c0_g1_i1:306-800(-)